MPLDNVEIYKYIYIYIHMYLYMCIYIYIRVPFFARKVRSMCCWFGRKTHSTACSDRRGWLRSGILREVQALGVP